MSWEAREIKDVFSRFLETEELREAQRDAEEEVKFQKLLEKYSVIIKALKQDPAPAPGLGIYTAELFLNTAEGRLSRIPEKWHSFVLERCTADTMQEVIEKMTTMAYEIENLSFVPRELPQPEENVACLEGMLCPSCSGDIEILAGQIRTDYKPYDQKQLRFCQYCGEHLVIDALTGVAYVFSGCVE